MTLALMQEGLLNPHSINSADPAGPFDFSAPHSRPVAQHCGYRQAAAPHSRCWTCCARPNEPHRTWASAEQVQKPGGQRGSGIAGPKPGLTNPAGPRLGVPAPFHPPKASDCGNAVLKYLSCLGMEPARLSQKQMYSFQSRS